jgi:ribosomal protein S12 methylthiotransferase
MKIHIISLGCPKNLVDSETIAGMLKNDGHEMTQYPAQSDFIVINTCSFIRKAAGESEKTIKAAAGYGKKTIVCGCLPQSEGEDIRNKFPWVYAFTGVGMHHLIPQIVNETGENARLIAGTTRSQGHAHLSGHAHSDGQAASGETAAPVYRTSSPDYIMSASTPREISTGRSYAYLKISDGCNNRCNYCLIPAIRGRHRSRPVADVVEEARRIAGKGVHEIIIVGQDTTAYGRDLNGGKGLLAPLIRKLSQIRDVGWIRLLYTHPGHFSDDIIDAMASSEKVCRYVDLPIQHTRDEILYRMGRRSLKSWESSPAQRGRPPARTSFKLIEKLRKKMPGIAIRTTVLVGFPGETERTFNSMLGDLKDVSFDWLGCFEYSKQKGTPAAGLPGQVPREEKHRRYAAVMSLQRGITASKNEARIGKTVRVLIDSAKYGHTEFQCPEIDGKFLIAGKIPGQFVSLKISGVRRCYDLY